MDPMQVACWQNLIVALLLLPFAAGQLPRPAGAGPLLAGAAGHFLHGPVPLPVRLSLTRLNARSAGLVIALEPVYAIAFAWALFSQEPTPRMMAGAALIVAAIVWSGLRKQPPTELATKIQP